ncbi:cell division protein ZapC [Vibrio metoecus]|uniref:cell division protein ZapC n=1 Tax=Vibrio metoecus TaxID=1481663 RepID=UPI0006D7BE4D|nr:cell division protein ZapC [Vibrio metoecus]KQA19867.1 cell division protein ZapC [Vibrio metoecus]
MLKPSDKWSWYYSDNEGYLMLNLGDDMLFRTNLSRNLLVDCAFAENHFTVDDASDFQLYKERIACLPLSEPRKAELALYCIAAKRFHKPVQPKSWFFDSQNSEFIPEQGDLIILRNGLNYGIFIALEVGENASLCAYTDLVSFALNENKALEFGQVIKVMHDRMSDANTLFLTQPMAMVS